MKVLYKCQCGQVNFDPNELCEVSSATVLELDAPAKALTPEEVEADLRDRDERAQMDRWLNARNPHSYVAQGRNSDVERELTVPPDEPPIEKTEGQKLFEQLIAASTRSTK